MKIRSHEQLDSFQMAFNAAMLIFEVSKKFPRTEIYSLTDQIRRSSRSVCANIAEAFRSRRYSRSFISKLIISEAEAAETQTWLKFALQCKYLDLPNYEKLVADYENILGKLVTMERQADKWGV